MKIQPFSLIQDNLQNNRKLLQYHYLPFTLVQHDLCTQQTITYNIYIYNKKYLKEKKNIELTGLRNTLEGQSISKSIKN